ncbi:hypothetical protein IQ254_24955 [Nodosilinea sp. LEGE 07088]|uniref:hypothetical protein n=1 Tax=Nodosilinea sp. LEGE 07088 TaxID=2777968 RepID=UPI001882DC10|nr:hypothetical protein [Nodosilinea sp. LEGE 07088]MBE9140411.1 hypothetical protein [Nodosilinea sp. LEGE 07088]
MSPNPFLGVWQRRSIQFDQGPIETSQSVLWIQGETFFADVRQSLFAGLLTPERYAALDWRSRFDADLLGFAGSFSWQEDDATCTWHQHLTLAPRLWSDTSGYEWLDSDTFLERGTWDDGNGEFHRFVEHWCRIHPGPVAVWHLNRGDLQGQALVAGAWAAMVHQWRSPSANPLHDRETFAAFSATAWRHQQGTWQPLFGTEASLGSPPRWTPLDLAAIAAPVVPKLDSEFN